MAIDVPLLIRIIVLDPAFREGIDLIDVKYVHIFENQTSAAVLKQAIGLFFQLFLIEWSKGLKFNPTKGWVLHVFLYDVSIPKQFQQKYNAETLKQLYIKNSAINFAELNFLAELEKYSILGSQSWLRIKQKYSLNRKCS